MQYRLILPFILLCLFSTANAQSNIGPAGDAIYLANGTRFKNAQIIEITEERVKFTVKRGETLTPYNYGRDLVLMAFTQEGNFLVIDEVSKDNAEADQQLKDFLMAPARTSSTDVLVRRTPLEVLRGQISYESEEVVNYQPVSGGAGSISKNELMIIFYRDGKHQVLTDFVEMAPILTELRPQLITPVSRPVIAPSPPNVPVTEPIAETPVAEAPVVRPTPSRPERVINTPPAPVRPPAPAPAAAISGKPSLNETEYITYRTKAVQRVDEFVAYINIITDKSASGDDKDRAIREAQSLFMPDAKIEVTSANKTIPPRSMSISTYLNRLKLLPYTYTEVTWSNVQYVKELTQGPDGNYYGMIAGQQKFTGYGKGNQVDYEDVTEKNVRVKLKSNQKLIDGQTETSWQVLLGSVGVGSK
ncbi:hypothetical protein [Fibrella aquatica]|uniref:hypothetical protein n=1 Tax=Fibrella aquatica TaxID=3242487 RepID=UPI00352247B2